ncbi:MAG TPA: hypothetical protein PK530_14065, partial [Anaerolineales bacterium]|nr:hypothetical protein [Anaerolineales bacterium]
EGTKLAWWVYGALNGGEAKTALAIFDLEGKSVIILHPYTPISGEGYSNPVWSPDGQWLASNVMGEDSRSALWVFKADGTEEQRLGDGANPVWSPGSNALVFIQWTDGPAWQGILNRVLISDWMAAPLSLPPGTFPIAWMSE